MKPPSKSSKKVKKQQVSNEYTKLLRSLAYISLIRFPKYPSHFFPAFLFVQLIKRAVKMIGKFRLRPLPRHYYELLIKNEFLKSEHFIFVADSVYEDYCKIPNLNWMNLCFLNNQVVGVAAAAAAATTSSGRPLSRSASTNSSCILNGGRTQHEPEIVKKILNKPNSTVLVPILPLPMYTADTTIIYCNENAYYNFISKYKLMKKPPAISRNTSRSSTETPSEIGGKEDTDPLDDDYEEVIYVKLQEFQEKHNSLPQLSIKATIFLINTPYELSSDITDEILDRYFEVPRILYRNYTYEITLSEKQLGNHLYTQYFSIFSNLKKLYFRCVHVESKDSSQFDICGIVMKGLTNLHQTTSINLMIPQQYLDDLTPVKWYSPGLHQTFKQLRLSILPFILSSTASIAPSDSNISISSVSGGGGGVTTNNTDNTLSLRNIFPCFLIQGSRGSGKNTVVNAVARSLGIQIYAIDCAEIVSQIPAQTEAKLKIVLSKANICEPLIICLYNFEIFGIDNEGREDLRIISMFQTELQNLFKKTRSYPVILVAMSSEKVIKPLIQRLFLDIVYIETPTKHERFKILEWLHVKNSFTEEIFSNGNNDTMLPSLNLHESIWRNSRGTGSGAGAGSNTTLRDCELDTLKLIADKTQGFLFGDLKLLYDNSMKFNHEHRIQLAEFEKNIQIMQNTFVDSLGAPKVPTVLWSDIGGLSKLKDEIQSSIGLPLKHMHLMGKNMRRSGILLYGPPGTGKTLVAKAVATECNLSFLAVQGPELLNMYVGQSEQNVREVFDRARAAAPCVVFLDELDSLAPNRGASGDSGGVMDRVVSQLLAEMDGMTNNIDQQKQIFILAATNRPDLIDPALLRPGRFDKLLYVGPCITLDDKIAVLNAQMKKFTLDKDLSVKSIAELLKEDMTGADIYSICSNAWLGAVRRTINKYQNEATTNDDEKELIAEDVIVQLDDFKVAASNFIPSVNKKDLEYFSKLRKTFSN